MKGRKQARSQKKAKKAKKKWSKKRRRKSKPTTTKRRSNQQFEELVDNNNNLKQRERGRSKWQNMDQSKDVLETEIEELWQLMMKQSIWRKMIAAGSMINQNLNLIDKERKMKQKTTDIQQQQRCKSIWTVTN
jgi:oligoendopeptidase F